MAKGIRICRDCNKEFIAGSLALYCKDCFKARHKSWAKQNYVKKNPVKPKEVTCKWCGETHVIERGHTKEYVCEECRKGVCPVCNKEFRKDRKTSKFCSVECADMAKKKSQIKVKACKECGKEFKYVSESSELCPKCEKESLNDIKVYCSKKLKDCSKEKAIKDLAERFNLTKVQALEEYNQWRKKYV